MQLPRTNHPRHLAGKGSPAVRPADLFADFDVDAALEPGADFDFDALFDDPDELAPAPQPRIQAARHKVAFAVAVTLAALPLLAVDNFQSAADPAPASARVETSAEADDEPATPDRSTRRGSASASVAVDATIAEATVYVGDPTTTTTVEDTTTTTTEKPAPTTTEKPAPPTTRPAPTTTVAPAAAPRSGPDPSSEATWDELARCESGGNWAAVSEPRNGMQYYGGLQFSRSSWEAVGGPGLPSDAPKSTQIEMGRRLQARQGWGAWPSCSRKLGWT